MLDTIVKVFVKLLGGSRNERLVRARMAVVTERIAAADAVLMDEYRALVRASAGDGDADRLLAAAEALGYIPLAARDWLGGKSAEFRRRMREGESESDILPEAFAAVRMASWLARNHRQFDVQLVAGQFIHEGLAVEEATGEGKTIACYPAIYLTVLTGQKVHVVTTNDYLVARDREFAAPIFDLLDVTVGAILQPMDSDARHPQYACDVIYGMNSEFGFDYLRDNMKLSVPDQVQGPQDFAIVDEVDSLLIDEARTPLIISGPAYGNPERYRKADRVVREIIKRHRGYRQAASRVDALKRTVKALAGEASRGDDAKKASAAKKRDKAQSELDEAENGLSQHVKFYEVELDKKSAHLTHEGVSAAQEIAGIGSFYVGANMEWPHLLDQALRAHVVYERDKDYVVRVDEVVIVDEFTGRLMEGREWSDGLHQAIEAKERVSVKEENQTLATITLQNFFKMYGRLAGMTGTAMTEAEEFMKIYELDVVAVPTHRPVNRVDHNDRIFGTVAEKYDAAVEEINECSKAGRPVLVGTTSIEKSEALSEMLTRRYGVQHQVLNGRIESSDTEGEIVKFAGQQRPLKSGGKTRVGMVTIATNMAGRGTDIKLGPGVVCATCKTPSPERLAELGLAPEPLFPAGATKCCLHCPQYDPATGCAHCFKPKIDDAFPLRGRTECRETVPCGLHIVGTERHEARRIDNQLRGRSGRQGDPGSSRFFLSLRDDLLAIFAGEWTLKVLGWLGLQDGQAIEDKRITKGIERAQKKVEQRNFDIRKNLLEYDEVMDRQRRIFYARRQEALEGRGIRETIGEMIRQAVSDAVGDYLAPDYPRRCIVEWARVNLELTLRPDQIRGDSIEELAVIEDELRAAARDEAAATINITLGEYADPSVPAKEWDLRGLASWAMSRFRVNVSQNQLRPMDLEEMERLLVEQAQAHIDEVDLSGVERYLEAGYASRSLAEWARNKFGVELTPGELPADEPASAEEAVLRAVEGVYRRREIEYPPEWAIDVTVGQAGTDNAYALGSLCDWANRKYAAGWTAEHLAGRDVEDIRQELFDLAEPFFAGDGVDRAVDEFLASPDARPDPPAAAARWARQRFDTDLDPADLAETDLRAALIDAGRAFCRRELTELERFVLLQIYDTSWKDHLLAMDHLRSGVGLRGYAEQDPKIVYKKEGFRQFQEMLSAVREKVTDLIFKARLRGEGEMESVYQVSQMVHEQLSGYDHLAQEMAVQQAAAGPTKVEQIVRQQPKVGRNDPCPCGSGKKFKKCCGRNA